MLKTSAWAIINETYNAIAEKIGYTGQDNERNGVPRLVAALPAINASKSNCRTSGQRVG